MDDSDTPLQHNDHGTHQADLGDMHLDELSQRPRAASPGRDSRGNALPWLLVVLLLIGGAAVWMLAVQPLQDELRQLHAALAESNGAVVKLQSQVTALTQSKDALEAARANLTNVVEEKDKDLEALQRTQEELAQKLAQEVERGNVAIHQSQGELIVDLIDQIVFDSGADEVNAQGKQVLQQVAEAMLKVPDKILEVRGHTDAMPVSAKLAKQFPTNWELSTQRAINVVRFLQDHSQVPGQRLVAAGFSQYRPLADNKSKMGRRRNRRIEIVLLPLHRGHP